MRHTEHEGVPGAQEQTLEKRQESRAERRTSVALDAQVGTRLRAGSARGLEVAPGKVSSNLKSKDRPCFYLTQKLGDHRCG